MKQVLPTNNVDDILSDAMGGKRRFNLIPNEDGTYSLEDVSTYDQIGTSFGALNVNATNNAVNESADKNKVIDDLDIIKATTEAGYMAGALAVKELTNSLNALPTYSKNNLTSMVTSEYGTINSCAYEINGTMAVLHLNITITSEVPSNAVLLNNIPLRPNMNGMQIPLYKYGAKATYMARIGRTDDAKVNQIMTYDSIPSGTTIRTEFVFTATLRL